MSFESRLFVKTGTIYPVLTFAAIAPFAAIVWSRVRQPR